MVIPNPPIKLEGHCSTIHANSLYVYSPSGFASIPLTLNGAWSELPMGQPVTDSECVQGGVDGNDDQQALYVVGGTGAAPDYPGIQRYVFNEQRWETLSISTPVTRNRVNHGVTYLKATSSILVYGGSQHGSKDASSETFAINTAMPYNISSFNADGVSAATSPVLVPWPNGGAAMLSGSTSNMIYGFSLSNGWAYSGLSFAGQIPRKRGYALTRGPDGSWILQSFMMEVSPNSVSSIPILNSDGSPSFPNGLVPVNSLTTRKRDTGPQDYPVYNSTLAPLSPRKDYSLAQDETGSLVVISGGDPAEPLAIFNQKSNGWINVTELFYGNQQPLPPNPPPPTLVSPPTSSATHRSQSTAVPTSSPHPPYSHKDSSSHTSGGTIAGATIGSIAGVALLLLAILFFMRRRLGGKSRDKEDDKDRLSFQDRGLEPLTEAAYPMARSPIPLATRSVDSMGIFTGNVGSGGAGVKPSQPPAIQVTGPNSQTQASAVQKSAPMITVESAPSDSPSPPRSSNNALNYEWPWLNPPPAAGSGGVAGDRTTADRWNRYFDGGRASNASVVLPAAPHVARSPVSSIASRPGGLNPINAGTPGDRSTVDRWNRFFEKP